MAKPAAKKSPTKSRAKKGTPKPAVKKRSSKLAAKACVPCRGGVPPLSSKEIRELHAQIDGWQVINKHHLEKNFDFPNFSAALRFTLQVGELAEEQDHHPDIYLAWGKVGLKIWTHKIDGLTESDFILAAKLDELR